MSIGEKIQQFRKARGLSQEQLADSLDVSRQAVSKWETDQSSPDIENILALSKFFSVTTDELLGNDRASSAVDSAHCPEKTKRRASFDARQLGRLFGFLDSKIALVVASLLCLLAAGICVIVNFAVNRQLTWAAYPLISILLGWVVAAPLLFKKLVLALCALTAAIGPYLYCMDRLTRGPGWFVRLGLPIAAIGVAFLWLIYLLFRFVKIGAWYKTAIVALLAGVVVSPAIDLVTGETNALNLAINIFSGLFMAAIFWIIGYVRNKAKAGAK